LAVILVLGGTAAFTNIQKVNAQMSTSKMTGGMMGINAGGGGAGPNITGSIKLSTVIGNALSSQIKVGLNQAAVIAEKAVGNNSCCRSTFWSRNGYLVYTVWVIDGTYNFHRVVVGNG
jgi:hypothetical protein